MSISIFLCFISLLLTIRSIRIRIPSLGLPFAYLAILQLQHIPGAMAHIWRPELFSTTEFVAIGVWQTAVASLCFLGGLVLSRSTYLYLRRTTVTAINLRGGNSSIFWSSDLIFRRHFILFCFLSGWIFILFVNPLVNAPSIGAILEKGCAIWMLGVILGLRAAIERLDKISIAFWILALAIYPIFILLFAGFLSYGSSATIIVLSIFTVSARSYFRVVIGTILVAFVGLSLFVNYFNSRDQIRSIVWGEATLGERVSVVTDAFKQISILNFSKDEHALALDERLNQNYFSGLAASNLDAGIVEYRNFQQFYEALIAPIPRAIWPDKPVFGGSGSIVRDMTGLNLSDATSWGAGQVMEFYISFGWPSLIAGFILLGWIFGRLDYSAAVAIRQRDTRSLLISFLPAVALTQPLGSLVELVGGGGAAYFAALAWNYLWNVWIRRMRPKMPKVVAGR